MCFCADGAKTHCTRGKAFNDFGFGLDFIDIDAIDILEGQESAQGCVACIVVVDVVGKCPVAVLAVAASSVLQERHGLRVPHVGFAVPAPVEVPRVGQDT